MSEHIIWGVIIAMAIANFIVRFVPIAAISRVELPRPVMRWLSFVPVSVMGSLVAGEVLRPGGNLLSPWHNPYLMAALPTALVYYKTRSFLGATLAGMLVFVALRAIVG